MGACFGRGFGVRGGIGGLCVPGHRSLVFALCLLLGVADESNDNTPQKQRHDEDTLECDQYGRPPHDHEAETAEEKNDPDEKRHRKAVITCRSCCYN